MPAAALSLLCGSIGDIGQKEPSGAYLGLFLVNCPGSCKPFSDVERLIGIHSNNEQN